MTILKVTAAAIRKGAGIDPTDCIVRYIFEMFMDVYPKKQRLYSQNVLQ